MQITSVNKKAWNQFVFNHPQGSIFQTMDMAEVYDRTRGLESISLCVTEGEKILSILNGFIMRLSRRKLPLAACAFIQTGPLFLQTPEGRTAAALTLKEFDRRVMHSTLFTQVRMIHNMPELAELLNSLQYTKEEHLTFFIDLNRSEQQLWTALHKSRRKGINRAKKLGVQIAELSSPETRQVIPQIYGYMENTYRRAGIPFEDISILYAVADLLVPKNMAKFFAAYHFNELVAARIVLLYKDTIYDWHTGSSQRACELYANEYIVWHVLTWGAQNGFKRFDFMGAGSPKEEYGPREFKRRFGGTLAPYDRFTKVYHPLLLTCAKKIRTALMFLRDKTCFASFIK